MMRIASATLFLLSSLALGIVAFVVDVPSIGYGALALGALSVAGTLFPVDRNLLDVLLASHAALCCVGAVFRLPTLLLVTVMALTITAWDAARVGRRIADAEPSELRQFTVRYLSRAFVVPGAAIGLVAISGLVTLDLPFGPAVGLSVGGLLIAALLLRFLRGSGEQEDVAATQEKNAGDDSRRRPSR